VCLCVQDFERQEGERSDYLQKHLLKYVDICVEVDEASAEVSKKMEDGQRVRLKT